MPYYYNHAGIAYGENSARIIPNLASFASLPGELRNLAYASTLKWTHPMTIKYDNGTHRFHIVDVKRTTGRVPLDVLKLLSSLDHNIRIEARSYFFANNTFQLEAQQSWTTDPDYIETYIYFLSLIGDVGSRSLRYLRLEATGDPSLHRPNSNKAITFWEYIADCTNLSTLDIYADIDYFYMDQHTGLKFYLSTEGYPISKPWSEVLLAFENLKNLKSLVLHPVFSSRWRCFDIHVDGRITTGQAMRQDLTQLRFVLHRPVDEAARVSEQLKGYLRMGLRGKAGVRVVMMGTWGRRRADVIFERDDVAGEDWEMIWPRGTVKLGREFHYHGGFKSEG
jgi:hypothetical protein